MPIYEFHCEKCDKESELLVRSSEWQGAECPHCGSTKLSKKLSVFASNQGGSSSPMPSCPMQSGRKGHGGGCGCCH